MADSKDLPQDIGGFIRDLRQTAKISLRQLADKAGVSNPYLSQIERGLRKPSAEVLQQIASALRVSTPAMYLRAGLLDSEGQQGVLAAIAVDADLTIAKEGTGRLYYRVGLRTAPDDLTLDPLDRGFTVSRTYETFRNANARHDPAAPDPAPTDVETALDLDEEAALRAAIATETTSETTTVTEEKR